ncbi:MAG: hypothetical protein ACP5E4_03325 [Candidatus Aenigmatarchaeota archaeon]
MDAGRFGDRIYDALPAISERFLHNISEAMNYAGTDEGGRYVALAAAGVILAAWKGRDTFHKVKKKLQTNPKYIKREYNMGESFTLSSLEERLNEYMSALNKVPERNVGKFRPLARTLGALSNLLEPAEEMEGIDHKSYLKERLEMGNYYLDLYELFRPLEGWFFLSQALPEGERHKIVLQRLSDGIEGDLNTVQAQISEGYAQLSGLDRTQKPSRVESARRKFVAKLKREDCLPDERDLNKAINSLLREEELLDAKLNVARDYEARLIDGANAFCTLHPKYKLEIDSMYSEPLHAPAVEITKEVPEVPVEDEITGDPAEEHSEVIE